MSLFGLIKAPSHTGTEKLKAMVHGKSVAIVGNAQSLFGKNLGSEIDAHDVVIRLNRGFIVDPSQQGSRTDIIGTARPLSLEQIQRYNPKLVYWLFWRWWRLPTWNAETWEKTEVVPVSLWRKANKQLSKRPTSGFVMVNTILDHTSSTRVNTFGFDFYETPNFYRGAKMGNAHKPMDEGDCLRQRAKSNPLFVIN
jgi:hypothetical protein